MNRWEALARRYCAIAGRDPDAFTNGVPEWRFAVDELTDAMTALDTFDLDVRERFESPVRSPQAARRSGNVIAFPTSAA